MIPQTVGGGFDTFEIVRQDDSGPDEPFVWTFSHVLLKLF